MMIKIENASIAFGREVLFSGRSLLVRRGELACITGASGKGKSSLLNAVMGFVPLREGRIVVGDVELSPSTIDRIREKIAWLPQELALPNEWVSEMVAAPFEIKLNRPKRLSLTTPSDCKDSPLKGSMLELFPLLDLEPELFDKRVREISGGQRQRIMIAVASLLNKDLLITDEPTSALDPASVTRVISFFRSLQQRGMTILAVSHDSRLVDAADVVFTL